MSINRPILIIDRNRDETIAQFKKWGMPEHEANNFCFLHESKAGNPDVMASLTEPHRLDKGQFKMAMKSGLLGQGQGSSDTPSELTAIANLLNDQGIFLYRVGMESAASLRLLLKPVFQQVYLTQPGLIKGTTIYNGRYKAVYEKRRQLGAIVIAFKGQPTSLKKLCQEVPGVRYALQATFFRAGKDESQTLDFSSFLDALDLEFGLTPPEETKPQPQPQDPDCDGAEIALQVLQLNYEVEIALQVLQLTAQTWLYIEGFNVSIKALLEALKKAAAQNNTDLKKLADLIVKLGEMVSLAFDKKEPIKEAADDCNHLAKELNDPLLMTAVAGLNQTIVSLAEEKPSSSNNEFKRVQIKRPASPYHANNVQSKLLHFCDRYLDHNRNQLADFLREKELKEEIDSRQLALKLDGEIASLAVQIKTAAAFDLKEEKDKNTIKQAVATVLAEHAAMRTQENQNNLPYSTTLYNNLETLLKLSQLPHASQLPRSFFKYVNQNDAALGQFLGHFKSDYRLYQKCVKRALVIEIKNIASRGGSWLSVTDKIKGHIEKGKSLAILEKNCESEGTYYLKLLSVIGILVGVGIFTTLGLMAKRLYDTQGASANFFKPLSQNLKESLYDVEQKARRANTFKGKGQGAGLVLLWENPTMRAPQPPRR